RGPESLRKLLEAVDRSQRIRAADVEPWHAVAVVVLVEMHEIAGDQEVAFFSQLNQQTVVARRVSGGIQDHDAAVPEDVLVRRQGLDLAAAADPVREWRSVHAGGRLGRG